MSFFFLFLALCAESLLLPKTAPPSSSLFMDVWINTISSVDPIENTAVSGLFLLQRFCFVFPLTTTPTKTVL